MKINTIETIRIAMENLKDTLENVMLNEQDLDLLIYNRQELVFLLETIDWENQKSNPVDELFFLIEKDGKPEPVYFGFDDEDNRWHEHHCTHECRKIPVDEIPEFVAYYYRHSEYPFALALAKSMYRDGVQHKISCYGSAPFLDGEFKIVRILSEVECLDWILAYEKEHQITDIQEFRY